MELDLWLPDDQTVTVEWYITDQKQALGVEHIREEWKRVPIGRPPHLGFEPPRDKRNG